MDTLFGHVHAGDMKEKQNAAESWQNLTCLRRHFGRQEELGYGG